METGSGDCIYGIGERIYSLDSNQNQVCKFLQKKKEPKHWLDLIKIFPKNE
jgi:hypothetical protein